MWAGHLPKGPGGDLQLKLRVRTAIAGFCGQGACVACWGPDGCEFEIRCISLGFPDRNGKPSGYEDLCLVGS